MVIMYGERVSLEQIDRLPTEASHDRPDDGVYVKLGCAVCPHAVSFKATGITSTLPRCSLNPEATQDFKDMMDEVAMRSELYQGVTLENDAPCSEPCPQLDAMQLTLELLNDEFEADLRLP